MATYEYTGTKSDTYRKGERIRTVDGSVHDKRLAANKHFKPADKQAKQATSEAES